MASKLPKCPICGSPPTIYGEEELGCGNAKCALCYASYPPPVWRKLCRDIAKLRAKREPKGKVLARGWWIPKDKGLDGETTIWPRLLDIAPSDRPVAKFVEVRAVTGRVGK